MVDATRLGAWLRPGEGIGWLAAGTMPKSLYRVPFVYFFLACVFCYCYSFISRWSFVDVQLIFFCPADHVPDWRPRIRGCQSGTWSQRGTKVNGSHHGDNPLLRPTGIQIATKSYVTLQAMAPTNIKTVHQTSFTPYRIESSLDRLVVVAYPRPAFSATNRTNTFQPVLINNSKFLKATHLTKIRKI